MKRVKYSRWDGTQKWRELADEELAARLFKELSNYMNWSLSAQEAMEWLMRQGLDLPDMNVRVMGTDELISELLDAAQQLYDRYRMDAALDEIRERLDEILDREQQALREAFGYESARMNDFLSRRHNEPRELSETIESLRDHAFEDEQAGEDFRDLQEEFERLKALEDFLRERGERFRGSEPADYETAQAVRERIQVGVSVVQWDATRREPS